jgi:hypothetical protein
MNLLGAALPRAEDMMTTPLIFITTYAIKEGKLQRFMQFVRGLIDVLEGDEPSDACSGLASHTDKGLDQRVGAILAPREENLGLGEPIDPRPARSPSPTRRRYWPAS